MANERRGCARAAATMTSQALARLVLGLGISSSLLVASCSGDGDDDAGPGDSTATTEPSTTTTQPEASGAGQDAAFTFVEDLVVEATDLTDRLLQEPSLATDDDSPDVQRLREIYTEDSPTPPEVLARLDELVSNGEAIRAGPSGIFREFFVHGMAAVDATTIRFNFCANQDQETVDAEGNVVDRFAEVSQGAGEARYVDGTWLFFGLHRDDETSIPTEPGAALPGFCQSLYGDEDEDQS